MVYNRAVSNEVSQQKLDIEKCFGRQLAIKRCLCIFVKFGDNATQAFRLFGLNIKGWNKKARKIDGRRVNSLNGYSIYGMGYEEKITITTK